MKYKDCHPITPRRIAAWLVEPKGDGKKRLILVDPELTVPDVISIMKRNMKGEFTILNLSSGDFTVSGKRKLFYCSGDDRRVSNKLAME